MMLSPRWMLTAALLAAVPGRTVVAATTPEDALTRLKEGNGRFVAGALTAVPTDRAARERLLGGESPIAAVMSCADSRVPPEYVFNAALGDLYVVRTAGHVADKSVVASVEHATADLQAPLLVVMGHASCAVVQKAVSSHGPSASANADHLLSQIRPAAERVASQPEHDRIKAAIFANIEQSINDLLRQSPAVSRLVDAGKLQVVGAYYEMSSGRVAFTKPVTQAPLAMPAPKTTSTTSAHGPADAHATDHGAPAAHAAPAAKPAAAGHAPAADHGKH